MSATKKEVKAQLSEEKRIELYTRYINEKKTYKELGAEFGVSAQTASNIVKRFNENQIIRPENNNSSSGNTPINSVPAPLAYSLSDAAIEAKISSAQILHYGALGKLELCIPIEPGATPISSATIREINLMADEGANLAEFHLIVALDKVDYLVLEPADIIRLERFEYSLRVQFSGGYFIRSDGSLVFREPPGHRMEDLEKPEFFHLITKYDPKVNPRIDLKKIGGNQYIDRSKLRVRRDALNMFIEAEKARIPAQQPPKEDFILHENSSIMLIELEQVAFEIWGDFNPIKAVEYNTPERVAEYLVSKFSFHNIHAKYGAIIIFPTDVNRILNREKPYRTEMLQTLIDGWQEICRDYSFGDGKDAKYDSKTKYDNKAKKWLSSRSLTFAKSQALLSSAIKIMLSEKAPFDHPRKASSKKS